MIIVSIDLQNHDFQVLFFFFYEISLLTSWNRVAILYSGSFFAINDELSHSLAIFFEHNEIIWQCSFRRVRKYLERDFKAEGR